MGTEYLTQCLLKKVGRAVVTAGRHVILLIDLQGHGIAELQHPLAHHTDVGDLVAADMLRGCHLERGLAAELDHTGITDLATHGAVERGLRCDDRAMLTIGKCLYDGILCISIIRCEGNHRHDLRIRLELVVADEAACDRRIELIIYGRCVAAVICHLTRSETIVTCLLLLAVHRRLEGCLIDGEALLLEDFLRVIEREAIGIIKLERILTGKLMRTACGELRLHLLEDLHALLVGLLELLFLRLDDAQDEVLLLIKLRITILRGLDDTACQRRQEGATDAELTSMTYGTTDDTTEYVATAVVGRHDTVGDHEGHRTGVVGHDTYRYVALLAARCLILDATGELADEITKILQRIDVEDGSYILNGDGETLETHTGIDVLLREVTVVSLTIVIKLREYDVPDFHVTVALAAHDVLRAVSVLLTTIIVDLGTWSARSGAVLPEVVFLTELVDVVLRDMHHILPDVIRLLIVYINRRIQTVRIQADTLGQELPCPWNRFLLEVIAEREVSEHLKEGTVAGCLTNILQVTGTDALLAGGDSASRRNLLSCKPWLHRCHSGIDNEQ